ncbi:hypothetical protein GJ700_30570 [Duganella sp. FT92W]|uniref:Uncharacterized protein n=1 Tax=Pseudoduganella rivuli TaxID=2666085 RepID=A0A7X2LXC6_9BURK|nr:hypothetical protein [Pseudoduganella rivuli]MRV76067.1 hypothetical protein [Pseudoduganella rivuli]
MDYQIIFFCANNQINSISGAHRHTAVYLPNDRAAFSTGAADTLLSTNGPAGALRSAGHSALPPGVYYRSDLGFGHCVLTSTTRAGVTLSEVRTHATSWSAAHPTTGSTHYPHNCRGYADDFIRNFSTSLSSAEELRRGLQALFDRCKS